jgi:uncharacterized membrane protein
VAIGSHGRLGHSDAGMKRLTDVGRVVFGFSGRWRDPQQLLRLDFVQGPLIAPQWVPWRLFWACASALVLVVTGLGVAMDRERRLAGVLMSGVLLLGVALFHLPGAGAVLHDGVARTRAFETLALFSAALLLTWPAAAPVGSALFAASLAVFGIQHFMYAAFIATLIPSWIPWPLFWAYFTGIAFIAASGAIVAGPLARLAAALLGLMFLLWAVVLHAPRVLAHLSDAGELNSALVALAFSGASWLITATPREGRVYLGQSQPKVPAVKRA